MRALLVLLLLTIFAWGDEKGELLKFYQNHEYQKGCSYGLINFEKFRKDEDFVSIYALCCLNSDEINRLAVPIIILKNSKEARANAAYFSVILTQKKLLCHALMDDVDISGLNLPKTDHILSKVFKLFTEKKYKKDNNMYLFIDETNPSISYRMFAKIEESICKLILQKYINGILVKEHTFK